MGCVTGYAGAVLARLAATVILIQPDQTAIERIETLLEELAVDNVVVLASEDPSAGHPSQAPFDVILLVGAVDVVPPALCEQLGERAPGRGGRRRPDRGTLLIRLHGVIGSQVLFDAQIPRLPGLKPREEFAFDSRLSVRGATRRGAAGRTPCRWRSRRPSSPGCGRGRSPMQCSTCASPGRSRSAASPEHFTCRCAARRARARAAARPAADRPLSYRAAFASGYTVPASVRLERSGQSARRRRGVCARGRPGHGALLRSAGDDRDRSDERRECRCKQLLRYYRVWRGRCIGGSREPGHC